MTLSRGLPTAASRPGALSPVLLLLALFIGSWTTSAQSAVMPSECPTNSIPTTTKGNCDFNACTIATCTPKELMECKVFVDEDISEGGGGPLRCENPCLAGSGIWEGKVEFNQLKFVTGDFGCGAGSSAVESVKAPVLNTIAGTLSFSNIAALKFLYFPRLTHASKVVVKFNDNLNLLYVPYLKEISDQLLVASNEKLGAVDLVSLEEVGSNLVFTDNVDLEYIGLPKLQEVDGELSVLDNPDLKALVMPGLKDVGSTVEFINNVDLKFVAAPKLYDIEGPLDFHLNPRNDKSDKANHKTGDPALLFVPSLKEVSKDEISTLDFKGAVIAPSLKEGYIQKSKDVLLYDQKFDDVHIYECNGNCGPSDNRLAPDGA